MATQQGMSGVDLVAVTAELRRLLPLWVHKVYLGEDRIAAIRMNTKEREKRTLLIEPGRRLHLVPEVPEFPIIPPAFAMLLRKYLVGGRILDIRQRGLQRTVIIDIQKSDQVYHLIIEAFDVGNIILCNEDYSIVQPLTRQKFKDRDVLPGIVYSFPPHDVSLQTRDEYIAMLKADDRDIVRALAVGSFLGGMYAEQVCRTAGIPKETPAAEVDGGIVYDAIHALLAEAQDHPAAVITKSGCHPVITADPTLQGPYPTFSDALVVYYPKKVREIKEAKPKISREERIRRQQEESVKKFERQIKRYEEIVEKIYEEYSFVQEVITTLSAASKMRSWQEIEDILKADTQGVGKRIKLVFPAEAAVDLDLGILVKIFVHDTVEQNAGRNYDQIKKFKKKLTGAKAAMERQIQQPVRKAAGYSKPKNKWFHRFRWFYTSDGILVIGGRDAGQNEDLVKKYLEGGDTFLHADIHGASVVVVKGKTECWDEVSRFAAAYSGAWRSGFGTADVYAARPDQVSKTAESGEYLSRGSFVVRGERQWFKSVPLEIAIGLQKKPETRIIGGPTSAVQNRTDFFLMLSPGTFEPNDVAKKVVRVLRDRLPMSEQKALKFALNTESIAAFVPPGGSDIREEVKDA
ncbi:MAG TPA: ribosome rescue protein RqcH [Methanospirillum sp.]|uniref:ribosome rescue protein RqcH n=1 Tax=Methanospirillum sp. TaxID=45200 RepID=UPI002C3AE9B7|nr:ribosome rescue protein RqcH [Methanospirillum sp.]HWQ63495.1 ribosome rescue protein RqcH [Methanospirillum sp.]